MCRENSREKYPGNALLTLGRRHQQQVVGVAVRCLRVCVSRGVLLVAPVAGGVGDAAMLQAMQAEPRFGVDHLLLERRSDHALPSARGVPGRQHHHLGRLRQQRRIHHLLCDQVSTD